MNQKISVVRNGKVRDAEINLLRQAVGWVYEKGSYRRVLPRSFSYFVARDMKRLVGFVNIISDGVADAFLVDLMVHPDFQRRGLGKELISRAATYVKSKRIQCLHVTFDEKLSKFYEKAGFHVFGGGIMDFKNMKIALEKL